MSIFPSKVNYTTGQVLTATEMNEIGQAINLLESAQFAAGKNAIINGDFRINQRNFVSFNPSAVGIDQYNFDRFLTNTVGGTATVSPQTFTAGTAPVPGYEGTNFLRGVTTGQASTADYFYFGQKIEDVRTYAGQTVTVSFWAKAATGAPSIGISLQQNFGSGGSASVPNSFGLKTISTSWTRYTASLAIPSISGKTIGTSSFLNFQLWTSVGTVISGLGYPAVGLQNITVDVWGVQVEAASTASNFQTATGTKQGELAACQRYYYRTSGQTYGRLGLGAAATTTSAQIPVNLPVTMRTAPTSVDSSTLLLYDLVNLVTPTSVTLTSVGQSLNVGTVDVAVASGLTQFRPYLLTNNNSASGYIGFSAEL